MGWIWQPNEHFLKKINKQIWFKLIFGTIPIKQLENNNIGFLFMLPRAFYESHGHSDIVANSEITGQVILNLFANGSFKT